MERIGLFSIPPDLRDMDEEGRILSSTAHSTAAESTTGSIKPDDVNPDESLIWDQLKQVKVEGYDKQKINQWLHSSEIVAE
jgi:hypothetical protein